MKDMINKISNAFKKFFSDNNITKFAGKMYVSMNNKYTNCKNAIKNIGEKFKNRFGNNIKKPFTDTQKASVFSALSGYITNKFSKFFKGIGTSIKRFANFEDCKDGQKMSKFEYYGRKVVKGVCIVLAIAFFALVAYYIKDVFIPVLIAMAAIAAAVICAEFIFTVVSTATGFGF